MPRCHLVWALFFFGADFRSETEKLLCKPSERRFIALLAKLHRICCEISSHLHRHRRLHSAVGQLSVLMQIERTEILTMLHNLSLIMLKAYLSCIRQCSLGIKTFLISHNGCCKLLLLLFAYNLNMPSKCEINSPSSCIEN